MASKKSASGSKGRSAPSLGAKIDPNKAKAAANTRKPASPRRADTSPSGRPLSAELALHPALMEITSDVANCGQCVIDTIERVCQTHVGGAGDKLADLCAPCNSGVLSGLEEALRQCNDRSVTLSCGMSVRDVIVAVCA